MFFNRKIAGRRTFAMISRTGAFQTRITEGVLLFCVPLEAPISHRQGLHDDVALYSLGTEAEEEVTSGLSSFTR